MLPVFILKSTKYAISIHHLHGFAHVQEHSYYFIKTHEIAETRYLSFMDFSEETDQCKYKMINFKPVHNI